MTARRALELVAGERDGRLLLLSPAVGLFTCAAANGRVLSGGETAGALACLDVVHELVVPAGVLGRVVSDAPERVHEPVGYRTPLYELAPIEAGAEAPRSAAAPREAEGGLAVRAPYSGRFWHRPAPGDPPFVSPGDVLEEGSVIGLVEVMKTFAHLHYEPGGELPARARVVRLLAGDGAEIAAGAPLLAIEPA